VETKAALEALISQKLYAKVIYLTTFNSELSALACVQSAYQLSTPEAPTPSGDISMKVWPYSPLRKSSVLLLETLRLECKTFSGMALL